ncbi:hypothetical protein GCM10023160_18800 [Brachybacterium paraconglomeratum]|uniref:helix-turn-helix domain-containing protein n=1 Tax=Brachybacterium paraconglomeratum TaxID=173362 RepID=UPI0031E6D0EA
MPETPKAMFARRLREERKAAGLTQVGVGELISRRLGVTIDGTAVTRIERGERSVKLEEAVAAAQALGVPLAALVSDEAPEVARLSELKAALRQQEGRAATAHAEILQAQAAMVHIEQEIEQLEAAGGS